ncbi:MAG TPA: glutathionylspermidine synthase family protein, partial [Bacillota bacterium]|nr:glutathionylspermidine synthase family protein [Bacillota bacterium]
YYLEDTCVQAGLEPKRIFIEDVGWDPKQRAFVDGNEEVIGALFKLYPWEWMWQEEFGQYLSEEACQLIEPAWKMLLSNKGLLPILWELYPNHPNLLPAFFAAEKPGHLNSYVKKPLLGREGANVSVSIRGQTACETEGDYGAEGFVVQALAPAAVFDGYHPIFGVWIVNHEAAGLGIREDRNLVTGNTSLFTPHIF